jgi:hypothetical protein
LSAHLGPSPRTNVARLPLNAADIPRIESAARLIVAGLQGSDAFKAMRDNAARELAGRRDGIGPVSAAELAHADDAIAREIATLQGTVRPPQTIAELASLSGRPQIPGLRIIYLHPLGLPKHANAWRYILVHQTEGPTGSARGGALAQATNPTKRGVTIWVESDGTIYWATAENAIPTQGDGANRNDNKYVDNRKTYRIVLKHNALGVEFAGNFPDVTKPASPEQVQAWSILVRFLQERYRIATDNIYAHNWIDFKDHRYCEGCALATLARSLGYVPGQSVAGR